MYEYTKQAQLSFETSIVRSMLIKSNDMAIHTNIPHFFNSFMSLSQSILLLFFPRRAINPDAFKK